MNSSIEIRLDFLPSLQRIVFLLQIGDIMVVDAATMRKHTVLNHFQTDMLNLVDFEFSADRYKFL